MRMSLKRMQNIEHKINHVMDEMRDINILITIHLQTTRSFWFNKFLVTIRYIVITFSFWCTICFTLHVRTSIASKQIHHPTTRHFFFFV